MKTKHLLSLKIEVGKSCRLSGSASSEQLFAFRVKGEGALCSGPSEITPGYSDPAQLDLPGILRKV